MFTHPKVQQMYKYWWNIYNSQAHNSMYINTLNIWDNLCLKIVNVVINRNIFVKQKEESEDTEFVEEPIPITTLTWYEYFFGKAKVD